MGMFDSLMVEFRGREYELQTKSFAKVLSSYHVGDLIEGAYPGSHAYLDTLYLDDKGGQINSDNYFERFHIIISLSETVFCEYLVIPWIEDDKILIQFLEAARTKWKEASLLIPVLLESLRVSNRKKAFYQRQQRSIQHMIDYSIDNTENIFSPHFVNKETKNKIDKGQLLDVIQTELEIKFNDSKENNDYQLKEVDSYYL